MNEQRYKVIEGSESAHCCFKASVVDTHCPVLDYSGKQWGDSFEPVCETFARADADLICAAMNATSMSRTSYEET